MSTILKDMQFELLPTLTAATGQVFGIGTDVSINDGGFQPGDDDWEQETETNPRRGGVAFGRDLLLGPVWGFDLHVDEEDLATATATLSKFKTAWRAMKIRQTPGAVIPLRYRINDRYRRVYGRPGRFNGDPDNLVLSGFIPITADFQCSDAFTYDDVESSVTLSLQVGSSGGFIFPDQFPLSALPVGLAQQQAVVGGDAETYPVVRFTGPVTNPSLELAEWTLSLDLTIPAGQFVEIDLRSWAMTCLLNNTASVAGAIGRRQYLEDMFLDPGNHMMIYRGSAGLSTSTCAVRWANAWNSY